MGYVQIVYWAECPTMHLFVNGDLFLHEYSLLGFYTAKLLFHHSPTRHSDYTVTSTVTMKSLLLVLGALTTGQ